jgi:hypothetical protein
MNLRWVLPRTLQLLNLLVQGHSVEEIGDALLDWESGIAVGEFVGRLLRLCGRGEEAREHQGVEPTAKATGH